MRVSIGLVASLAVLRLVWTATASAADGEAAGRLHRDHERAGQACSAVIDARSGAIGDYDCAIKLNCNHAGAYGNRGMAFYRKRDMTHAHHAHQACARSAWLDRPRGRYHQVPQGVRIAAWPTARDALQKLGAP
jgi:hypothetical protein